MLLSEHCLNPNVCTPLQKKIIEKNMLHELGQNTVYNYFARK